MPAPHVLGIDDASFDRSVDAEALVVGVVTAGPALLEGVATIRVPVDGERVTDRLVEWISGLRVRESLRAVFLDSLAIAGLSIIDIEALARGTGLPVIVVRREAPGATKIAAALEAAGLEKRIELVERAGAWKPAPFGAFLRAGVDEETARELVETQLGRARLPECVRLAHLIGAGVVLGESRGSR